MSKKQREDKRRARRAFLKEKKERMDKEAEDLEIDDRGVPEEPESVEKDYYAETVTPVLPAPTSFAELDAMKAAQEQAEAVEEVTWNVQMLVRNILRDEEMEPQEKVAAMQQVADGFGERLGMVEAEEKQTDDIDALEVDAILSKERRASGFLGTLEEWLTKATLTAARENALSDDKFALCVERDGKKVRKYPINDKAHVRNALARASQMIKRGGSAAADAKAALPKIHAAAKKMGIGSSIKKDHNAILVEKGADGGWRWVGWVSNNFIDWDADIFTEDSHKEYVEWVTKNMDVAPAFVSWHTPGTRREKPVDLVMYENGFLIMSGPLTETEAAGLLRVQKETDLGMSHGTFVMQRDASDPRQVLKYRMYEASDLPLERAANPFTDFALTQKEVGMDQLAYLTTVLGEERAKAFLEKTGLKKKDLVEAGIESKEQAKPEEKQAEPPPAAPPTEPAPPAAPPAPKLEEVTAQVLKEMDLPGLNALLTGMKEQIEKIPLLESVIKGLQADQNEKLAEALKPPAARFMWAKENRASDSKETVLKESDKDLKDKGPGVPPEYWLSTATGTAPVKSE